MLPPSPLSLLCAILLCFPLAAIFTFTTPCTTVTRGGATSSPLPLRPTNFTQIFFPQIPTSLPTTISLLKSHKENRTTIRKKKSITPPFVQDDEELDDSTLLKQASRVDPNPKPAKKIAFMFLTTSPLPLAPLWEQYFSRAAKKLYNVYVHADPKLNYTASFQGLFANRVIPSKPTRRYSPTLVAAARRLLAHALLHDTSNAMFALLSPSCVPIHSFDYTYKTLVRHSRKSFVEVLVNEPGAWDRWAARGEDVMLPEVPYEDFRIGSQFWVMKRRHARVAVSDTRIWSKFKLPCLSNDTCYPDEHYFPTLLSVVDTRGCIPCTLTHVDWRSSHGGHPRMYGGDEVNPDLIRSLRRSRPRYGDENTNVPDAPTNATGLANKNGTEDPNRSTRRRRHPFLFARKFSDESLDKLMSMAKDVIFKD